jgi:predicted MFS family arabinose efflux permease
MKERLRKAAKRPELYLFMILIALHALGNGFSDAIYANYYKEVYHVSAMQRAFIEFPRELPGVLCGVLIAALSFLGDIRLSLVAQCLTCAGLTFLGFFTPSFGVMLIFMFVNSLGMHLFMPLSDAIGMSLAEPDRIGKRVGQFASIKIACSFAAGIAVFVGFRTGFFTFAGNSYPVFLVGSVFLALAAVVCYALCRVTRGKATHTAAGRVRLLLRKEYKYYYLLTVLSGVQKQVAYVYGLWVIVDLLLKGTDVVSLLTIAASFIGIVFYRQFGKWMDRFGIRKMMFVDALSFIVIYLLYGLVVWAVTKSLIPQDSWKVLIVYALFVLDRMSMQTTIVKSVYLRSIAVSPEDITPALSTGISLDHVVSIGAAQLCGLIWTGLGPAWVFFFAAFVSLGNLFVATRVKKK